MPRFLIAFLVVLMALPAAAQTVDLVPDRRLVLTRDVDFYGSDLDALFDTDLAACQRACLGVDACAAFTFNSRTNACFPKSAVTEQQPYAGAISGRVLRAGQGAEQLAWTRAGDAGFLTEADFAAATAAASTIGERHPPDEWTAGDLLRFARDQRAAGNTLGAWRFTGAALALSDASDLWVEYARLGLELKGQNSSQTRRYRQSAVPAAINGYLRAGGTALQVSALDVLANALEQTGRGRDMIPALRLAQALQPRADLERRLEDAIGKHGFRITEHRVDSNSEAPRICAEFSEELVGAGVDYAPFVALSGSGFSVDASGSQLCIDGVEHGGRYRVTFREGLPAASGETLAKDVDLTLYVRDRAPGVRFAGRAYVLPKTDGAGLPVITVNTDTVDLTLKKVSDRNLLRTIQEGYFGRPLAHWEQQQFDGTIAEVVWQGTGTVTQELNRDVTTRLPLDAALKGQSAGIYALHARIPGADPYDEPGATQWFVLSDLGLTTMSGADGLHVFVRALSDAGAEDGMEVTLLSRANAVLGTAMTDARGYARFDAGLTRGQGSAAPAMVMVEDGAEDFAFLSLTEPEFDLSDRGVTGHPPAPALDVYLTTDRGAYRAGEVINAVALARDGLAMAVDGLPLTAILTRPDGVEYSRVVSAGGVAGGHVFAVPLGTTVPRGTWTLDIKADPKAAALASQTLLVEDFLPERIDFDLILPDAPIRLGDTPPLTIEARYLFGAPAADLPVEGEVTVLRTGALEGFPSYRFGRHDARFEPRTVPLPQGLRTGADGTLRTALALPDLDDPGQPLDLRVTARLSEGSGRPVEREVTVPLAPSAPVIGIRPLFDGVVGEGSEAAFEVLAIGPDLTPARMPVQWTLNRVQTRYQWYQLYGSWNWEPVTRRTRVASGTGTLGDVPLDIAGAVDWGQYELIVEKVGGTYAAASVDFYAGWYAPADAAATPDLLELSLDAEAYRPGDTARLRIVPRYAGTALVTVMSNRLIDMTAIDVAEGENLIDLLVTDDWGAGAYVTAQVIRPMDISAGQNPARSLGLAHAGVDPGDQLLAVSLDAPKQAAPRGPLEVSVLVEGVAEGDTAHVTLAAVDVGILNLTAHPSPDPQDHYFGQRRLGMGLRDVYGRLIDGMNGAMGTVRSGGDAGSQMRMESPPPTEQLVAYFTGPLTVGPDGRATASFDLPEFNGSVRLMAMAWTDRAVGQAEAEVLVRDPVVVTASLPRFLAPGDESRMLLELVHADGPVGEIGVAVTAQGVSLPASAAGISLAISEGGTARLSLPVTASAIGDHMIDIVVTTPDGTALTKSLTLPVRRNDPMTSRTRRFQLATGETFTLTGEVLAGYAPGTASVTLAAGPLARFDAPGLLSALDRYPYGCTEQVTSQAMPLLYFSSMSDALGLGGNARVRLRVGQAIDQVLTRQARNGAFGLWWAASGDFWLDAYVTDFLSRARAEGHLVPDIAFTTALDNLRNRINYAPDFDAGGEDVAYALMVLAREGAAAMGDLRYYADVKGDAFGTPLAAAQLGAALASYGDQTRADAMFARAAAMIEGKTPETGQLWRSDYGTDLRDAAGVLALAAEAGSRAVDRDALLRRVSDTRGPLSTQEQSWSLLAAHALVDAPGGAMLLNGAPVDGPLIRRFGDDLAVTEITNAGTIATDVTLTTFGVPEVADPAGGYGYAIKRAYYTMEGDPASDLRAGDRLVTVLTVSPFETGEARLMINDPLPAGLEIDNPNLLRAGDIGALDWLDPAAAEHTEFRSDRFLAAVDWRSGRAFQLAYVVRAISPGAFHHPAASVEDMYRPQYRARTGTTRLTIAE